MGGKGGIASDVGGLSHACQRPLLVVRGNALPLARRLACAQGSRKHYCINQRATRQSSVDEACEELLKESQVRGGSRPAGLIAALDNASPHPEGPWLALAALCFRAWPCTGSSPCACSLPAVSTPSSGCLALSRWSPCPPSPFAVPVLQKRALVRQLWLPVQVAGAAGRGAAASRGLQGAVQGALQGCRPGPRFRHARQQAPVPGEGSVAPAPALPPVTATPPLCPRLCPPPPPPPPAGCTPSRT